MNEIYRKLIENLYNYLHPSIQNFINNYGPERLYSLIKPGLPYLDNFLHGTSYVPYGIASSLVLYKALGIKEKDINLKEFKKSLKKYGYGLVGVIGPFIEEMLFRLIPSYIGKFIGGDMGEMAGLGISSLIFAAGHIDLFKNKKFRGFVSKLPQSLFLTHLPYRWFSKLVWLSFCY